MNGPRRRRRRHDDLRGGEAGARNGSLNKGGKNVRGGEVGKAPRSSRERPPTRGSKSAEIAIAALSSFLGDIAERVRCAVL